MTQQQRVFVAIVALFLLCICSASNACFLDPFEYDAYLDCDNTNLGLLSGLDIPYQPLFNFTITPTPPSYTLSSGDVFNYILSTSVNYTLEWKSEADSTCDGKDYLFTPNPYFAVSQPKCRLSQGSITFVKPDDLDFNSASCLDAPCNVTFTNNKNPVVTYQDNSITCSFNPIIYELSDSYPNIKVQDSYAYVSTGSVQLLDSSKYSKWTLDYKGQSITETSPATWTNLVGNARTYNLTLESIDCGVQIIPIQIQNTWPDFYLEYGTNTTCPRNSSISIIFNDPAIFTTSPVQVTAAGIPITQNGQSFYLNNIQSSTFTVSNFYHTLTYHRTAYTATLFGDIQYSIEPCTGLVTLYYNEAIYTDVYVIDEDDNHIVVTDKTFTITNFNPVYVKSPCFFSDIPISISPPVAPSYTIVRPQQYCGDTIDVLVANYYDFETLTMGDEVEIQHNGQGLFKNIDPDNFYINYQVDQCSPSKVISLPTLTYESDQIEETIEIITYPSCNYMPGGNVSYTVRDVVNNISSTSYFPFQAGEIVDIRTQFPQCSQEFYQQWKSPPINKNYDNFPGTITVVKKASCKYSSDASILIKSPGLIQNIVINGVTFIQTQNQPGLFEFLPYGDHTINIVLGQCPSHYVSVSIGTDNDWEFPAVVTPVTGDCSSSNGKITYENNGIFTSVNDPSFFTSLSSGYHNVNFALSNGTCTGSARIYVPTQSNFVVESTVLAQPLCQDSNDGVVKITIKDTNGLNYLPTGIEVNGVSTPSNMFAVKAGNHSLLVKRNLCSWIHKVSVEVNEPEFAFKKVFDSNEYCSQKTIVSITPPSNNIFINQVSSDYEFEKYSNNAYSYYPETFKKTRQIFITYNQVCLKVLRVEESQDLYKNIQWPTVTVPSVDCTDPSVQNTVAQINNPNNMLVYPGSNVGSGSIKNLYYPTYTFASPDLGFIDLKTQCSHTLRMINLNQGSVAKTITKPTCPGSVDGKINIDVDPQSNIYNVLGSAYGDFRYLPVESGSKLNTYNNISSVDYTLIRSFRNNPFCSVVENVNIVVDEPTVSLSSTGVCEASNTAIGDAGVVTNTLSITTTNVTYDINGVVSTNPVFKGLSAGDYSSTVTIYNSVCRRVIQSNSVSVAKLPSVSVNVDVSTCMKAVINPTVTTIQHQYTIKDSGDNVVHSSTSMGSFTFTATKKDTYSIYVSDNTCSYKTTFLITECATQPPTNAPTTGSSSSTEPTPSSSFKLIPSIISLFCFFVVFFI